MSGKGGNNRKNKQRFSKRRDETQKHERKRYTENYLTDGKYEKKRDNSQERLFWTAPSLPANPITTPDCPWCGQKINDITTAITDKETGSPVHFDCVLARINSMEAETLEQNDSICYIGGGRFGVVHFTNPMETRTFTIKKIYEWEDKETDIVWRKPISEYFSLT